MKNIADVEYSRGLRGHRNNLLMCQGAFQVLEALQGFFGSGCSRVELRHASYSMRMDFVHILAETA